MNLLMADEGIIVFLTIVGSFTVLFILLVLAVRWARRRTPGVMVTGALLSMFAPDPTFERNLRLAEKAKTEQMEEDEEGEKK